MKRIIGLIVIMLLFYTGGIFFGIAITPTSVKPEPVSLLDTYQTYDIYTLASAGASLGYLLEQSDLNEYDLSILLNATNLGYWTADAGLTLKETWEIIAESFDKAIKENKGEKYET